MSEAGAHGEGRSLIDNRAAVGYHFASSYVSCDAVDKPSERKPEGARAHFLRRHFQHLLFKRHPYQEEWYP